MRLPKPMHETTSIVPDGSAMGDARIGCDTLGGLIVWTDDAGAGITVPKPPRGRTERVLLWPPASRHFPVLRRWDTTNVAEDGAEDLACVTCMSAEVGATCRDRDSWTPQRVIAAPVMTAERLGLARDERASRAT